MVDGKDFRLADEVRYVRRCAARRDGRIVTIGQLILFSTETGDAWLLDKDDGLAAPLARDGDPQPIHIEETDAEQTPSAYVKKLVLRHDRARPGNTEMAGEPGIAGCERRHRR